MNSRRSFHLIVFFLLLLLETVGSIGQEGAGRKSIKILFVSGGSNSEFESQRAVIQNEINKRCGISLEWTIVNEDSEAEDARLKLYQDDEWAKGYDLVIHHEFLPGVKDQEWVNRILKPHREGVPALLIGGAVRSYQAAGRDWSGFSGANVSISEAKQPFEVSQVNTGHEIQRSIENWTMPKSDFSLVKPNPETTTIIAEARSNQDQTIQPVAWTNLFGPKNTRVFSTTLEVDPVSLSQDEYLTMLVSGLLWSVGEDVSKNLILSGGQLPEVKRPYHLGQNILLHQGKTDSSSTLSGYAIDGDPNTVWRTRQGDLINWWQVEFETETEVNAMVLYWEPKNRHPYHIEISTDGKHWRRVVESSLKSSDQALSYHEFSETVSVVRISNPDTGILNGLREVALYQSIESIPSHVRSATWSKSTPVSVTSRRTPTRTSHNPLEVLTIKKAIQLIEKSDDQSEWQAIFDRVGSGPGLVDELNSLIDSTKSGVVRHLAIKKLATLYRNEVGEVWERSGEIARYMESLMGRKQVSRKQLLFYINSQNMPVIDRDRIIELTDGFPELKLHRLKFLERFPYPPASSIGFLTDLVLDEIEVAEVKRRAAVLLATSSDMFALRHAFEAESSPGLSHPQLRENLRTNSTWEGQIDWLHEKAVTGISGEQILAWEVLLSILTDPGTRPENMKRIRQSLVETEEAAGESLASLISVIPGFLKDHEDRFLPILKRALSSDSKLMVEAAGKALNRDSDFSVLDATVDQLTPAYLKQVVGMVEESDIEAGKGTFRGLCADCHQGKGPPLRGLRKRFEDSDRLVDRILLPGNTIADGYSTIICDMKDGNQYRGFLGREASNVLELIDSAGNVARLKKDNIVSRNAINQSTMPDNVIDHLTIREFADLIAYLKTL